ncbi:MAG: hypothetical protein QME90_14105 [Thermodesulfobacteriota bacterium]|nr:hypothetical protein [Thermodesulfobacteriota bacterium]
MVVPMAAGGGTDLFTRTISRHLRKYLPGKPSLVVRNMPGAAGLTASNYAFAAAPGGLVSFTVNPTIVTSNVWRPKGTVYKLEEMHPIYGCSGGIVFYCKPGLIKEPKDIVTAKGLVFGHMAATGGISGAFICAKELLDIKVEKMVLGYDGEGPARLAFLTGEINCCGAGSDSYFASVKPYVDKGEAVPMFQSGLLDADGNIVRENSLSNIPTVLEMYRQIYGKDPSGPLWEAYKVIVGGSRTFGRTIVLPPSTPAQIVDLWKKAVAEMVKDPKFLEDKEKESPGIPMLYGPALTKGYRPGVSGSPEVTQLMKRLLSEKYGVVFD